jgi:tRNA G18 (ribose-2'-O)-methylase SpoU
MRQYGYFECKNSVNIPFENIVVGTEGDGLSTQVIAETDYVVRIPMWHEVDSLNVAAASAVAFWELRAR